MDIRCRIAIWLGMRWLHDVDYIIVQDDPRGLTQSFYCRCVRAGCPATHFMP